MGEALGQVEILVNNAGLTRDNLMMRMKESEFDEVLSTNLKGTYLCTRAALRPMIRARWGRIVNVSSVVGLVGNAGQANYAASKAGIIGFTKSVAREVAQRGITANVVAPGYVETELTSSLSERSRTRSGARYRRVGSRRRRRWPRSLRSWLAKAPDTLRARPWPSTAA